MGRASCVSSAEEEGGGEAGVCLVKGPLCSPAEQGAAGRGLIRPR